MFLSFLETIAPDEDPQVACIVFQDSKYGVLHILVTDIANLEPRFGIVSFPHAPLWRWHALYFRVMANPCGPQIFRAKNRPSRDVHGFYPIKKYIYS